MTGERRNNDLTLEVIREMREWFEQHEKEEHMKFDAIQAEIKQNRRESEERHGEMVRRMENMSHSTLSVVSEQNRALKEIHQLFKASFPDGDGDAHRLAHMKWIKKTEAEEEFWLDVKKKVVGWGAVALIGWIGIAVWAAFLQGPK